MARTDYYGIQTPVLQATSQAIRGVNGTVGTIAPEDYPDLISAMKSGTDYDNVMAQLVEETTTPASIASFTDGSNGLPVKELVCTINPTETGSGAKSPQNPYVIGGHTEINVYHRATNLWDETWELGRIDSSGQNTPSTDSIRSVNYIPVKPNLTCYIVIPARSYLMFYDANKNFLSSVNKASAGTQTIPNNCYFMRFAMSNAYGTSYNNDISINYPSTDTAYHAYNGQTHTADFGQTVYGGEFVAREGEFDKVTSGKGKITLDGTQNIQVVNWRPQTNSVGWLYPNDLINNEKPSGGGVMVAGTSNKLVMNTFNSVYSGDDDMFAFYHGSQYSMAVRVRDTSLTTKEAINAYLAQNPIDIYYPLATPTEITLPTKTQLNTLLGANNIYHDCNGNTEVTYRANGGLYVAQH